MRLLSETTVRVLKDTPAFFLRALKNFNANQGLLLAAAIAYYALLSVVPFLILSVIALSHVVGPADVLDALSRFLELVVPSQSKAVLDDVTLFFEERVKIGLVLLATMLFFSSLAFSVLEKAMHVIFAHRQAVYRRPFMVSAIIQFCFVLFLAVALLLVTLASLALQGMARESMVLLGWEISLRGVSGNLLYLLGLVVEAAIFALIYLVMPVGRMPVHHALLGAVAASAIWEGVRRLLIWYFSSLSKASVVYGSLTTAVVAMLSMEIAATVLLFGAQIIAEYERLKAGENR